MLPYLLVSFEFTANQRKVLHNHYHHRRRIFATAMHNTTTHRKVLDSPSFCCLIHPSAALSNEAAKQRTLAAYLALSFSLTMFSPTSARDPDSQLKATALSSPVRWRTCQGKVCMHVCCTTSHTCTSPARPNTRYVTPPSHLELYRHTCCEQTLKLPGTSERRCHLLVLNKGTLLSTAHLS